MPGDRRAGPFALDMLQHQVNQICGGLVAGEMSAASHRFSRLAMQAFTRVGGVNDFPERRSQSKKKESMAHRHIIEFDSYFVCFIILKRPEYIQIRPVCGEFCRRPPRVAVTSRDNGVANDSCDGPLPCYPDRLLPFSVHAPRSFDARCC